MHINTMYRPDQKFNDFAIPPTWALIRMWDPREPMDGEATVYTQDAWSTRIMCYDWSIRDDIWRRMSGRCMTREEVREEWKMRVINGRITRNMITDPLDGDDPTRPWDIYACHFSGRTNTFYDLLKTYGNYPRKA